MSFASYSLAVLLYCLIGVLFLVAYILAMKPQEKTTMLGLIMLFWPVIIALEFILAIAQQFGSIGKLFAERLKADRARRGA